MKLLSNEEVRLPGSTDLYLRRKNCLGRVAAVVGQRAEERRARKEEKACHLKDRGDVMCGELYRKYDRTKKSRQGSLVYIL